MATGRKTGGRGKGTRNRLTADVKAAAGAHTADAIATLAAIMQDKGAPPQARVAAAKELLDRAHGKSAQAVELSGPDGRDLMIRWQS